MNEAEARIEELYNMIEKLETKIEALEKDKEVLLKALREAYNI